MFNDEVDAATLHYEAMKYYANILTPLSDLIRKKLDEITPSTSPSTSSPRATASLAGQPGQIIEKYARWCRAYKENQITIVYDTMWNGTRRLAESIAEGILSVDKDVIVKLYNITKSDQNDVLTEVFRSKAVLVGSPTHARGVLHSMAGFLYLVKHMKFKGKYAAAFGCHGWSGEGVGILNAMLDDAGFTRLGDGLKALWSPDEETRRKAFDFGANFARECLKAEAGGK